EKGGIPMRRARTDLRLQFFGFLMLAGLAALVGRLWFVQILEGHIYQEKIRKGSEVTVRIPSIRGEIRDRNGLTLAENRASYEVDFYLPDMVRGFKNKFGKVPIYKYEIPVKGMMTKREEEDIIKIVNDGIIPKLEDLNLAHDYSAHSL